MNYFNGIYRSDLDVDGMPIRIKKLPILRGYPVPWFVAKNDDGVYDFRCIDGRKIPQALQERRCWICGQQLGTTISFIIGPMCAINRTVSEPASHNDCALWAIKNCPFLNQSEKMRREAGLPKNAVAPPGIFVKRQPGCVCMWSTKHFSTFMCDGRIFFRIGHPLQVDWFSCGREATRCEVLESMKTGYEILLESAKRDGLEAIDVLQKQAIVAMEYLPL